MEQKRPEAEPLSITVLLCTYNRCGLLAEALKSLAASKLPGSNVWDVLVVDNNSNDQTRQVAEDFCRRFPGRFTYVFEPKQGKSHALNTGIELARGRILAFTDDDVTVEPDWLGNLTAELIDGKFTGAGGRTLPEDTFAVPKWLSADEPIQWGGILGGLFDLGSEPRELPLAPYGANMAFRKEMFEKYGKFRTDLGPCGGNLMKSEDTEFGRRLMMGGERLCYEPTAIVHHPVPPTRLRKDYFLGFWFDLGRAEVREREPGPSVFGIPRNYLRILRLGIVEAVPGVFRWLCSFRPARRFFLKCQVRRTMGRFAELRSRL
jgi:glucosyl-dolichyl phosphate glucuronosyltransferase